MTHPRFRTFLKVIARLSGSYLAFCLLLWLIQDVLLFPLLPARLISSAGSPAPPEHLDRFTVTTPDGAELDVWTSYGKNPQLTAPYVGMIFHGNGETVATGNFLPFFARHGIPAFTFDYRGYGSSTGWISESKLLEDAETVWQAIHLKTGIPASRAIILGNSIGSGPATWLASRINPHSLILFAGYASIPQILDDMPIYRPFSWLLRYQLPTAQYLSRVKARCVILAHGEEDTVINFRHLDLLSNSINKDLVTKTVILPNSSASHNDIYYKVEGELDRAFDQCLIDPTMTTPSPTWGIE